LEDGASFAAHIAFKDRQLVPACVLTNGVYRGSVPDNDPDFRFQLLTLAYAEDEAFPLVNKLTTVLRARKYPTSHVALPGSAGQGLSPQWATSVTLWMDSLDRL
jgi:hypothetical protein